MERFEEVLDEEFMFDTADATYIEKVWEQLKPHISGKMVTGITTNPSALMKIDCFLLEDMEKIITNLCILLTDIREGESGGFVHVQVPYTRMLECHLFDWIEYVRELSDGITGVVVKVPHFNHTLNTLDVWQSNINVPINVTGISDWGTIIKALSYEPVKYASLIPGRMDEVGIDGDETMMYLAGIHRSPYKRIIAGSMRTIIGLHNAIYCGLVPTIGSRIWDQYLEDDSWDLFFKPWLEYGAHIHHRTIAKFSHSPLVGDVNRKLSKQFFKQMDDLGNHLFEEFLQRVEG